MNISHQQILSQMAAEYARQEVVRCEPLAQSGSHRQYFRVHLQNGNRLIGAYNDDVAENVAFFTYTRFFTDCGFAVPELFLVNSDQQHYLQSDLGATTLYDYRMAHRRDDGIPSDDTVAYYEKVVRALPALQLSAKKGLDKRYTIAMHKGRIGRHLLIKMR